MLKIMDKLSISSLNRDLATLAYAKLRKLFQATTSQLKETLFLAVKKLVKQYLASFILKGDNKGFKGLLIEAYTNIGIITNLLVSTVAIAIVKAIVKDITKAIVKAIAKAIVKAKGEVEVEENASIEKQFCVLLEVGILLFIIASVLLIIFI